MNQSLKSRIQNIQNEVKELHPLLDTIFRKMPTLEKVEYTHGPNEKGADFILTKISEELGDTEYIGVIVKIGKITQSIQSIDEQIDECQLRRVSANGKKEIYLSEIWVAVNGTISNNAKDKIYHKYQSKKVKFLDINTLLDLTQKYFPDFGVNIGIADSKLLANEKNLCLLRESQCSLFSGVGSSDTVIQQDIIHIDEDFSQSAKAVNIFSVVEKSKFVSIESQMGGGKSKLLNSLVLHFSNPDIYEEKRIVPIYFNSKHALGREVSLKELVEEKTGEYQFDDCEKRVFLVLLDGLDESKSSDGEASKRILSLIEEVDESSNIKLVITSRSIANERLESNDVFRLNRYEIRPIKLSKMVKFLEQVCSKLDFKTRLIEDLKSSDLFKVLPKTPIAAIILAKLLTEDSDELPTNLTELYSKYCELALGRWDVDKGLKTQKQYETLDVLVSLIAKFMINNELSCISSHEAKEIFKEYLSERNLQLDADDLFADLLDRSGIVVEDTLNRTVSFKHRSFAEYFYARSLLLEHSVDVDSKIFSPYWSNSYFFYVGLKKDCPELLEGIIDIPVESEEQRFFRTMNMGGFLLAGYQSPYRIIEKGIQSVFRDAGNHYEEIYHQKKESFFSKLPPMHLLSLFSSVLDQGYRYKFFESAISKLVEEVATEPEQLLSNGKPYTLFFLDKTRYQLGGSSLFDSVNDLYGSDLPVVLQLAMGHVSHKLSYDSPALKKTQKRLRKHAKTSVSFRKSIQQVYDDSIDGSFKLGGNGMKRERK